jgi:hypothetical protein
VLALNEILRRALFRAHLSEDDIAASLGVDPKTVRRWIDGRIPYPRHRWALADLLVANERDLWPDLGFADPAVTLPAEIVTVYPHRWAVPRRTWCELFQAAVRGIDVVAYSSLFLAEDSGLTSTLVRRAKAGVMIRLALGDPSCPHVTERGVQEGIDDAMAAKIRNALALYRSLTDVAHAAVRLHRTVLYNSIYRADDQMLVNQHAFGVPAAEAPVSHLRRAPDGAMFDGYVASFERIWSQAVPFTHSAGF